MIKITHKGDFEKLTKFLINSNEKMSKLDLKKYGEAGLNALRSATPVKTGKTANSWSYKITKKNKRYSIEFTNSNIVNGVPIAIILQYGHGTKSGGWVEGRDYINPAIQPVFDKIADEAWKEVLNN